MDFLYLDNAASSHPKPPEVYEAADRALRLGANPGRAGHRAALDAARLITEARELAAKLFNASDPARIVFTHNATHAVNQALKGALKAGDHVVTSVMEHNSLLRPLHALAAEGVEVTLVDADLEGRVDPDKVAAAVKPATKMVALAHASNVCGAVLDAGAVGRICAERGLLFLLDASQTAGSVPIDVELMGVSLLAAPGHKGLLGPQGTGLLYVAPGVTLRPLLQGGTGSLSESREMPAELPEALEAGTLNTPGIAGLAEGMRFLLRRTVEDVRRAEREILSRLLDRLGAVDGIALYGPPASGDRVAVVSFNLGGKDGAHVGYALDEAFGIGVRVGLHCAPDAHKALGTFPRGTVRASFGPFNTVEDADRLCEAVKAIARL